MCLIHPLKTIPLLTVGDVQPRVLVIDHDHLPQEQKEGEERILDQCQGLRVGEWTEIGLLHRRLLVVDEIGPITTVVVMTVNERESKIEIGILLLRVIGRLRLRLLVGRDRRTDLHRRISRDVMRPCMRDERKRYVAEEEVDIGVERGIEDMNVVAAKGSTCSSLFKCYLVSNIPDSMECW